MMTKYQKAEILRKKLAKIDAQMGSIVTQWNKSGDDKKYKPLFDRADKADDIAYSNYWHYVFKYFHKDDIDNARKIAHDFTSRKFLMVLAALDQRRIKKGRMNYV